MSLDPCRTKISIPFHNREDGMRSERTSFPRAQAQADTERSLPTQSHPSQSSSHLSLSAIPFPCSSWHRHGLPNHAGSGPCR